MLYWSLKTLLSEPMRLAVSVLAVAVSFIFVIFFRAVFEGESDQMVAYIKKMNADAWVMQKGVSNMHMASSMLWDWKADKIAQLPEVKEVSTMLYLNCPVKVAGKNWFSYIIGISPEYSRAGPWSLVQGKAMPGSGEAVIPDVISKMTGVKIGDQITMIDRELKIVGLTRGTFSMASSLFFVSHQDLGDLLDASDQYSYIMVYAKPGVATNILVGRIKQDLEKINVLSGKEFIENDWKLAVHMGAKIIRMMTILGTMLATLIIAFTAYSLITRKKQELAIAKALGYKNSQLYLAVLFQNLLLSVVGLLLALVISFTLLAWLPTLIPQVNLSIRLHHFTSVAIIVFPVATLASLAAARTVAKLDPLSVFQS